MKGYVHNYTGDGKGKTTAALGLSIRAAGAGLRVYIGQFIKSGEYSEITALERFSDLITVEQFGRGCFIKGKPGFEDVKLAQKGIERVKEVLISGDYNIVMLDEANVAVTCELIEVQDLLDIIEMRPDDVELVVTGRYADSRVIEKSDLVTEMKELNHYFRKGVLARIGIEK